MRLSEIANKKTKLAIGLMSGTSGDGIDAVLIEIQGNSIDTKVKQLEFITIPFHDDTRTRILQIATGETINAEEICKLNFYLGHLMADACLNLCKKANISPTQIDFVGSHGQTIHHQPQCEEYLGMKINSTLQIGEASVIVEALGCIVVSDFRVRDMAAGGLGAPLVPYTEYLLYRSKTENVALQNIGGIGNITYLGANCSLDDVFAFDTGPGNMVMDSLAYIATQGRCSYDKNGSLAKSGKINTMLLSDMLKDSYLQLDIPKTTGRERYGKEYTNKLLEIVKHNHIDINDVIATANRFTAETIRIGIEKFCPQMPDKLIIGGGGSQNPVLMKNIAECLPNCKVMTNEDIGLDSNSKEAVAFAVLANETISQICNNAPKATGAKHPVVMGKISL